MSGNQLEHAGKAWKLGDDVSTDDIILGKRLEIRNFDELKEYLFETKFKNFAADVNRGDIIVAGTNFGCGSSREQAPILLKHVGISMVLARSFARIFFRNAVNIGLPVFEIDAGFQDQVEHLDEVRYSIFPPVVERVTSGAILRAKDVPDFFREIIEAGGAIKRLQAEFGISR